MKGFHDAEFQRVEARDRTMLAAWRKRGRASEPAHMPSTRSKQQLTQNNICFRGPTSKLPVGPLGLRENDSGTKQQSRKLATLSHGDL